MNAARLLCTRCGQEVNAAGSRAKDRLAALITEPSLPRRPQGRAANAPGTAVHLAWSGAGAGGVSGCTTFAPF